MYSYRELIDVLNKATEAYDKGTPIMTDKEWDDLYFSLKEMEKETGIIYPDSPTQSIHAVIVPRLEKVEHNHPMLSLQKTKSIDDLIDFIGDKEVVIMAKMDGLTCSLKYVNGELASAETRGNGMIGEDILHNAKVIPSIPKNIPYKDELIVDGEIICTYNDFKTFEEEYKNPRNFAAGSIRLLSAKECNTRKLTFIAWDVIKGFEEYLSGMSLMGRLAALENNGFTVVPGRLKGKTIPSTAFDKVSNIIKEIKDICTHNGYPIDGAVVKYNDVAYGRSLGATEHHFKNAIAYKFYDETYRTKLLDIEWTMGRTGTLTPVAVFEPIDIDGSTVERASLHNVSIMKELLGIPHKFQEIEVFKSNMIIPQIASADRTKHGPLFYEEYPAFGVPEVCPICGADVNVEKDNDSEFAVCGNPQCEGKLINRIDHFCGKKGLDIKGLSKATIEKLIDWGWLNSISDLFLLHNYETEWIKKPGFGEKSVRNILTAIEESKHNELWKFISALGIPLIGSTYAKDICKHEYDWFNIREDIAKGYDFSKWDGFGYEMNNALHSFDYVEADYLVDEVLHLVNSLYSENRRIIITNQALANKKIVITGKLKNFKNRDELKVIIEKNGGKVVDSISKTTSMLINNDINSDSSKNKAAKKVGIPIITEEDFISQYLENMD